jgi:hypothetical protein
MWNTFNIPQQRQYIHCTIGEFTTNEFPLPI